MTKEEEIEIAYALHTGRIRYPRHYKDRRFEEQQGKCHYCEVEMTYTPNCPDYCTADHRQPRVLGGSDDYDNIAACCKTCNELKGAMTEEQYLDSDSFQYRLAYLRGEFYPYPWQDDDLRSGILVKQQQQQHSILTK